MVDMDFWKNKKVLITGYEGFLGSNLTKALLNFGADIYGLDILTHRKKTILSRKDLRKIKVTEDSVENFTLIKKIIKDNKIKIIFHLAARALVNDGLQNPIKTFSTNIKGTWSVLEASRNSNHLEALIVASSDKAYGNSKLLPYRENFPLSGKHPYDVSKSCADLIANAYFHTYGLPVSVTRCGNIYGPGDFNFSRIVPDAIKSAILGKTLLIRSNGKFSRDYIFVEDIVNGYILLAENLERLKLNGEAFNFSCEKPVTVIDLVREIYQLNHKKPSYKILNKAKYEIKHQYLSSWKARKIINWQPRYNLREGLKKTVDWYRGFLKNDDGLFKYQEGYNGKIF